MQCRNTSALPTIGIDGCAGERVGAKNVIWRYGACGTHRVHKHYLPRVPAIRHGTLERQSQFCARLDNVNIKIKLTWAYRRSFSSPGPITQHLWIAQTHLVFPPVRRSCAVLAPMTVAQPLPPVDIPTQAVDKLPQPFRLVDEMMCEIVELAMCDIFQRELERDRARALTPATVCHSMEMRSTDMR